MNKYTHQYIQSLIDTKRQEDRTIEYKSELNLKDQEKKSEFLKDITAFANSSGGIIIYGLSEEQGCPVDFHYLQGDRDQILQQVTNICRDNISPRLIFDHYVIENPDNSSEFLLLIQVRKSWNSPHMINMGSPKFYRRANGVTNPMDVFEIRDSFSENSDFFEKAEKWHLERCQMILAGETSINERIRSKTLLIMHLISLGSFSRRLEIDLNDFYKDVIQMDPSLTSRYDSKTDNYNYDGIILSDYLDIDRHSYYQFFRQGRIELVQPFATTHAGFDLRKMQSDITSWIEKQLKFLISKAGLLPVILYTSLVNCNDMSIYKPSYDDPLKLNKEEYNLEGVIFEEFDDNVEKLIDRIFLPIWNSVGMRAAPKKLLTHENP